MPLASDLINEGWAILAQATNSPAAALPAGSNVIGHVIADSGSTTAVTGNVTAVQATGTNLHTVVDSGSITANAGTNLNTSALQLDATGAALNLAQGSTTSGQTGPLIQTATTTGAPTYTTAKTNPLSTTTAGALRVDGSAATQPVSGAFWQATQPVSGTVAATQSGTWNIGTVTTLTGITNALPAGTNVIGHVIADSGSTTAVTGTVTVSGTVTANAGTGTLATSNAALALAQASTTSGQTGPIIQGAVTTSAPTYTTAQTDPLSLTTAGALRVDGSGVTQPVSGTVTTTPPSNASTNIAQINGVTPLMGNGATGTGSQRVTIASDNTAFAVNATLSAETTKVIGTVNQGTSPWVNNTSQINGVTPLMGNGVTGTGSQRVTIASDNTAFSVNGTLQTQTDTVMVGGVNVKEINGVTPLMGNGTSGTGAQRVVIASDNTANSNPFLVTTVPSASAGGTTLYTLTLAASTNATNVKASAGQLYSISGFNASSATPVWISLYNNAGTPTCGTSIIQQFLIPGSTTGTGFVYDFSSPKAFATGIAFCATTGIAGTGSPAATTYVLNIDYK